MDDLIYCQRQIPKEKWRYGFRTSAATGCGWIATYNALRLMDYKPQPEELIRFYQRQFPLVHGNFGTTILSPAMYFMSRGFSVEFTSRREKFDSLAKKSDVCILYYRWHNKFKFGAHFVALHHTEDGFIGYNTYKNSTGPDAYGRSLADFLRKKKYFGAVLIGIGNK